jgi:importin-5
MEAFASFFRNLTKKAQPKYFGLLPDVLNILPPIKDTHDSDDLSKALIALIDLAETCPKMFKPLFHNLVMFSVGVIQDKDLSDICRQNALELMATFADYAPSMCRKDPSYTNDMITQCLSLMTDLGEDDDDAAEWLASEDVRDPALPISLLISTVWWAMDYPRDCANKIYNSPTRKKATSIMSLENSVWID